ncbi:MAG TPA: hypothetical protein PLJ11_04425 [Methanomassiliicoccales archaeon]|nr:hypothetical protein [Methanomassiliicoccales archaeon]
MEGSEMNDVYGLIYWIIVGTMVLAEIAAGYLTYRHLEEADRCRR